MERFRNREPQETQAMPPFPVHALAPWQRDMVLAVSAESQTDPSMAAMYCLGFSSFTVARNVVVVGNRATGDPLPLWVVIIAESVEGKSSAFSPLLEPLRRLDHALRGLPAEPAQAYVAPSVAQPNENLIDAAQQPAPEPARRAPWATEEAALQAAIALQEGAYPKVPPRFLQRNITPGALADRIASQSLGVLQASPEGAVFSYMRGGTGALEPLSNYNSMWSGENIPIERVGRDTELLVRPILTLVVSPQPEVFQQIRSGQLGRLIGNTGFLWRCLFCCPPSNIGFRQPRSPSIPPEVQRAYDENVRAMLITATTRAPHTVHLEPHAGWDALHGEVEQRCHRTGDLHRIRGWAGRIPQNTARIAGILHLARHAGELQQETFRCPVSRETIDHAVEIGRWQLAHGTSVLTSQQGAAARVPETRPDLLTLIRTVVVGSGGVWVGIATELLHALRSAAPDHSDIPKVANQLSRVLGERSGGRGVGVDPGDFGGRA